jgi:hypothetical protein
MKIKKNGVVINLTESDLKKITKLVMTEEKTDIIDDLAKCCKDSGIEPPKSCLSGQYEKCIKDVGQMVVNDPLGMGFKATAALNCLKDKQKSPVKS